MLHLGLVSVTYRALPAEAVLSLAVEAGVAGIEWGGDRHVPHGALAIAREVGVKTRAAGLRVSSYGSYYRAGHDAELLFDTVLATAEALGAPLIRVWAGKAGSAEASPEYRRQVAEDCRRIAQEAAAAGIAVATEWHAGTLTDTRASAEAFFAQIESPGFATYWQPSEKKSEGENLAELDWAAHRLAGLHVFHWAAGSGERLRLAEGAAVWRRYLMRVPADRDLFGAIEFVAGDDPALLAPEVATLKSWLAQPRGCAILQP